MPSTGSAPPRGGDRALCDRRHRDRQRRHRPRSHRLWPRRDGWRDRASDPAAGGTALHLWQPGVRRDTANGPAIVGEAVRRVVQGFTTALGSMCDGDLDAITAELVARAADEGDPVAMDVIDRAGGWLGITLAGAIALLAPRWSSSAVGSLLPAVAFSARPRRSPALTRGSSMSRALRSGRRVWAMRLESSARRCRGGRTWEGMSAPMPLGSAFPTDAGDR